MQSKVGRSSEPDSPGARLRRVREQLGYSQVKFASMAGISQPMLSEIERGNRRISAKSLETISKHTEIGAVSTVTGRQPSDSLSALRDAWEAYDDVRERTRDFVARAIRISELLRKCWGDVKPVARRVLKDDDDYRQLEYWLTERCVQELQELIPQERVLRSEYESVAGVLAAEGAQDGELAIGDDLARLPASDVSLVAQIVRRLSATESGESRQLERVPAADRTAPRTEPDEITRIERIRQSIAAGDYLTPDKIDAAAERMIAQLRETARVAAEDRIA